MMVSREALRPPASSRQAAWFEHSYKIKLDNPVGRAGVIAAANKQFPSAGLVGAHQ